MTKFYKIPLTERAVRTSSGSLLDTLKEKYPALYRREMVRIQLLYGTNDPRITPEELQAIVKDYNSQTELLYRIHHMPLYIIASQEADGSLQEVVTKTPLSYSDKSILQVRRLIPREASSFLEDATGYAEVLTSFFSETKDNVYTKK